MRMLVMGKEKTKIEETLRRIDELTRILKFLSEDLAEISKNLKSYSKPLATSRPLQKSKPLKPPTTSQRTISFEEPSAPASSGEVRTMDDVQKAFAQDLADMLHFEEADEHVLVKPKQYLGSDTFRRIATIVRDQLGGEYVSAGKDSHFRIPRKP
ncbi:MAG: hypothetical protein NWF14_09280 [Candidatus Bathyarchaeota archaeon]|nr:hypothetical protein [Candidatus Bathyarchaeota archaeon]